VIDADTLARAQRGDRDACSAFIDHHAAEVLSIVGDEAAAAAVLVGVLGDLPKYALGAARLDAWIRIRAEKARGVASAGGPRAVPDGFSDQIVAAHFGRMPPVEAGVVGRAVTPAIVAAVIAVACVVALVLGFARTPTSRPAGARTGEVAAAVRTSVRIASHGVAVVEAGAAIRWTGAAIDQRAGSVFYRIEPGVAVAIRTPHGSVSTASACLRIAVGPAETVVTIDEGDAVVGIAAASAGTRTVLRP
jgi:hypothetical protein